MMIVNATQIKKYKLSKILEQILYFLFALLAFLIPFNKWIPEISAVIIFIFVWYYISNKQLTISNLKQYNYVLFSSAAFLSWVVCRSIVLFSEKDFENIFRYTGILFLPILCLSSFTFLDNKNTIYRILLIQILSNFIICIYSLIAALKSGVYFDIPFMSLFPGTWYVGIMSFSLLFIIACLTHYKDQHFLKIFLWIALVASLCAVYLASRRGIIISVVCVFIFIAFLKIRYSKKVTYKIAFAVGMIAVSLILSTNPRFKMIQPHKNYKYDIRLTMWETALRMGSKDIITLFTGYGLENGYAEYNQRLRAIEYFPENMKPNFNSTHNDFLDLYIMFGLIGVSLFLWMIGSAVYFAIKNRNLIFISFIIMASIQFFFGSYFFWIRAGKFSFFFIFALLMLLSNSLVAEKKYSPNNPNSFRSPRTHKNYCNSSRHIGFVARQEDESGFHDIDLPGAEKNVL